MRKSLEAQEQARKRIPGMTQMLSKRPDQFSSGVWPGYFSKAKGVDVWDLDGNRYVDMSIAGIGANVLGYADPDVDDAVRKAIDVGTSSSLNCPEDIELAELFCTLHPWAEQVRYARTGGEAMAIAVRIARAFTNREKIAFCGYHGWHDWYLAANLGTENALGEHLLSGLSPAGVPKSLTGTTLPFRFNQIEDLQNIVSHAGKDLAAIILEPMRNSAPTEPFLLTVLGVAEETGAVLIFDEISSGFRMNTGGIHLRFGVTPDVAVFSKALGNGYPIAAVIGKQRVMETAQKTFISSTNWTERIGPTAAIAMIKKHQQNDVGAHLVSIGRSVQKGWARCAEKNHIPLHVSGMYPMSHFSFEDSEPLLLKALFVQLMLERGFLASTSFYAMYAHQKEHVEAYLAAVDESFALIAEYKKSGTLEEHLKGKPAVAGFQRLT